MRNLWAHQLGISLPYLLLSSKIGTKELIGYSPNQQHKPRGDGSEAILVRFNVRMNGESVLGTVLIYEWLEMCSRNGSELGPVSESLPFFACERNSVLEPFQWTGSSTVNLLGETSRND